MAAPEIADLRRMSRTGRYHRQVISDAELIEQVRAAKRVRDDADDRLREARRNLGDLDRLQLLRDGMAGDDLTSISPGQPVKLAGGQAQAWALLLAPWGRDSIKKLRSGWYLITAQGLRGDADDPAPEAIVEVDGRPQGRTLEQIQQLCAAPAARLGDQLTEVWTWWQARVEMGAAQLALSGPLDELKQRERDLAAELEFELHDLGVFDALSETMFFLEEREVRGRPASGARTASGGLLERRPVRSEAVDRLAAALADVSAAVSEVEWGWAKAVRMQALPVNAPHSSRFKAPKIRRLAGDDAR